MTASLWLFLLTAAALLFGTEKYRDCLARRRMHESDRLIRERREWEDGLEREGREWFHRLRVATERELWRVRLEGHREAMELWEEHGKEDWQR